MRTTTTCRSIRESEMAVTKSTVCGRSSMTSSLVTSAGFFFCWKASEGELLSTRQLEQRVIAPRVVALRQRKTQQVVYQSDLESVGPTTAQLTCRLSGRSRAQYLESAGSGVRILNTAIPDAAFQRFCEGRCSHHNLTQSVDAILFIQPCVTNTWLVFGSYARRNRRNNWQ
jgi:hypothetical protein